ncbi:hypothetical protein C8F04DRAFT_1255777 [Mycena alexandri]|uniref:Uncharacterized protein n=1 Tax=Mycena alexandri TaxID=1745969 RepID=A0AAD6X7P3_9AGAR|nr:hypothetical protein C8F04DRAFT_1255777 [Mycena alexandri]
MQSLPIPVELCAQHLSTDAISEIRKSLVSACEKWLSDTISNMSSRLPLLQGRLERNEEGNYVSTALKLRQYLRVPVPAHRKALTRLVLSAHTLELRSSVMQSVDGNELRETSVSVVSAGWPWKATFFIDIYRLVPDLPRSWTSADDFLRRSVQCRDFDVT